MTERLRRAGAVAWALLGITGVAAVVALVVWRFRVVLPPLILAGAIVFILNPVVTALQHRGIPRAVGAGLSYLGVVALVVLLGFLVVPLATDQAEDLRGEWPEIQAKANRWIDDRAEQSEGTFLEFTRADLEDAFDSDLTFTEQLARVRRVGVRVLHVLLILVLAPIIAFYLLVDVPHLRKVAESLIPASAHDEVFVVAHRLNRAIGGFFRGQLAVALIVGVICSVGLGVIGLKFWFLVGMIAGFFNIIPLVGPWIGGIPGVAIALTTDGPVQAGLVVAIMAGAQQIDNHFITPQVMQRAVRLHPAAVMLALLAGGTLGGFFGLLLAVPTAAVAKIILSHLWRTYVLNEPVEQLAAAQAAADAAPGTGMVKDVGKAAEAGS
ncbi:MAG TPA: AI-2E family transporter [Acidimicrobiales bacterium]|nr:AI-2E family transporter [Acidimicrobiales bacterium]